MAAAQLRQFGRLYFYINIGVMPRPYTIPVQPSRVTRSPARCRVAFASHEDYGVGILIMPNIVVEKETAY